MEYFHKVDGIVTYFEESDVEESLLKYPSSVESTSFPLIEFIIQLEENKPDEATVIDKLTPVEFTQLAMIKHIPNQHEFKDVVRKHHATKSDKGIDLVSPEKIDQVETP